LMAFLHHPVRRPFLEILAGFQLLSSVKWCVPDSGEKTDSGVSIMVEKTRDLIAFSFSSLGCFLYFFALQFVSL
jgi:hypothetical protein